MGRPRSALHYLTSVADAVAQVADRHTAIETLMAGLSRALDTRACLLQRVARGWSLVAQTRGGVGVSIADLHQALDSVEPDKATAAVDLSGIGEGFWTFVSLPQLAGPPMAALLAGDWTADQSLESAAALVSLALRSVQDRELRGKANRLSVDGYRMARRLSRLGGIEAVCRGVVDQVSRSLGAERVALALYQPDEDRLAIAATSGYSISDVKDIRIEPGSWVLGHVYASGRSVLVPDVRQVHAMSAARRKYRTFSFAAVPMLAGRETIGVVCATDKHDNSPFDRDDAAALRILTASATLALMAARSDTEAVRLAHAATVDSLTGLFNRQYLDARLHQEVERARRGSSPLTVMMADIDDFKAINDTYGHQTGDAVLQAVSAIFRSAVRVFDVCARYGGDEFAILMPASDHSSAAACAERIRQRVADYSVPDGAVQRLPRITVSVGVAVTESGDAPHDLIRRADRCLYQAKADGKNRVRVNSPKATVRPMPVFLRRTNEPA